MVISPRQALGCPASYSVHVGARGGGKLLGRLEGVTAVGWDRKLNGVGALSVAIAKERTTPDCCRLLAAIEPWAHELHIYRDSDEVACGPVKTVVETEGVSGDGFAIGGTDVLGYFDNPGRLIAAGYNMTADAVDIAVQVLWNALALEDPGVGENLVTVPAGVVVSRAAARDSGSVLAELIALTASGLRFTTAVRTVYLGGTRGGPFASPIRLSVGHVAGDISITKDGTAFGNIVVGGSGTASAQVPTGQIPPDDPYRVRIGRSEPGWRGRTELLVMSSTGGTSQADVAAAAQNAYFNARRPRTLMIANDSMLTPDATVTVAGLVPGAIVKLAARDRFCTWVDEDLQLMRVTGKFDASGERIGISLGPVSS